MATGRVLVQRSLYPRFVEKLVAKAKSLKVGNRPPAMWPSAR